MTVPSANETCQGPNAIPHRTTPQPAPSAGPYHPPYQQPAAGPVYGAPQLGISVDKLKDDLQQLIIAEKAEFAQDPLDTSKQTRLKALLDLQTIIQSQDMPQDQLMIIRDRVAELAVNMRPQQPPVSGPAAGAGGAATYAGAPYTNTPTPPAVSQQPTPVPSAAAAIAAALARPPSAAAAPSAPAAGRVSIDSLFGQGALAALISGAARGSATPQQSTPTPQPPPAAAPPAISPAAAAVIAAALRSPPPQPQRPAEPARPAAAAPPPADPSALLAMLRQSGLIKPGATPTPPPAPLPGFPAQGGFQSLGGAVAGGNPLLQVSSLKT